MNKSAEQVSFITRENLKTGIFWRLAQGNYRSRSQLKAHLAKLMKKI